MEEDAHEGFLIPYESDRNGPDNDTEAESIISTREVEIANDEESDTLIRNKEGSDIFPEGKRLMQDIS